MVNCLLCDRELTPREDGLFDHPLVDDCQVELCDRFGVLVDPERWAQLQAEKQQTQVATAEELPLAPGDFIIDLNAFPPVDVVLAEIFANHGVERLGGQSSGRGWSSFNLFQKCPHAWRKRYIEAARPAIVVESPAIAIGSLIHTFLAVMYMRMIVSDYPLTPEEVKRLALLRARPEFVNEAWRVFVAYRLFYAYDTMVPLAVEHNLRDPRTGESCRYDLVGYFPDEALMRLPGTYIIEHKSAQRFDMATTDGWANDGEVLGQAELWRRLGLDKRFGPLRGVIVNICGKQKEAQFHRTIVAPTSLQLAHHSDELKRWEGLIQLARSTNSFPRARHSCVGRFGMCEWFDACASGE